ncbi:hypothetical protein [Agriterribacter sp.]|uniref:hypothetical protein n=1 Tax=Agriterribacter sp. TaxID=2821509 RepID=UPI002C276BE0|nr:hypothetical protein [Agriterribacter sp.]HRO46799.1 hypothetical protein [Agriterribacter sp.]HRQ15592.1 hypothetical protein [Agriterribacter sp.]
MRNIPATLSVLLLIFTLFSCQKELSFEKDSGNNPASLLGTWKFLELSVAVESGSTFDYGGIPGRIVATYAATTQNNKGFLTVTADKMETTDLGYSISAKVKIITYLGGIPVDPQPQEEQLDFDLPSSSASSDYQQVGSDSLYFPNGPIFDIPDTNGQQLPGASDPAGARFTITGDTLVIKSAVNKSTITRQGNSEYEVTQKVNGTATFLRQ